MFNLLMRLMQKLNRRRQIQFGFLLCLMFLSAFAEVISLGAVLPFLGAIVAPDTVLSQPMISDIALGLGLTSSDELILPFTVLFAVAALLAGAIRILLLWASTRLAVAVGVDLSNEVFYRTLYQPYQVHISRNSSEIISGITNKINSVVFLILVPLLVLVSSTLVLFAMMVALLVINPWVAIAAATGFGSIYALIALMFRRRLNRNSQCIAHEQTQVVKALQEGLGGIRDVLLNGTQAIYCENYRKADLPLRIAQGNNAFIGGSPRPSMEALGMVLIAALAYALSQRPGGIDTALPVLGALAIGAQRLMPALQHIYSSWASITGNKISLIDTLELLDQPLSNDSREENLSALVFHKNIQFRNVRFRYYRDGPWVVDGLNLSISKGSRVGFVGSTGSGKSTTLDLLMGLLSPNEGELLVDDQPLNDKNLKLWQCNISHVPQSIYLADATLAENIAFGVPPCEIDLERVKLAARQAQIAEFIESNANGYQAHVGERGVRLSGGQRQRIGIARALYKQANVLVFDEATSALDNTTEQSVMHAIEGLSSDLTILIIAHRLTTVRHCDTIIKLSEGKVLMQGTYDELFDSSPSSVRMNQSI